MKYYILLIAFIVTGCVASAQDILIPYKAGNQYGLCNQYGKVKLQPKYDNVIWLADEYFKTENKIVLNDTLETTPYNYFLRKNDEVKQTGLIYKGREIIGSQPYTSYRIYADKCIMAMCETRYNHLTKEQFRTFKGRDRFTSLFTVIGKNVYPENFRRLEMVDTIYLNAGNNKVKKLLLFSSENFGKRFSLFVFDTEKQDISQWLLKDVNKLRKARVAERSRAIAVDYIDSNNYMFTTVIDYSTGKFKLINQESNTESKKGNRGSEDVVEVVDIARDSYGMNDVAVPEEKGYIANPPEFKKPPFKPFYRAVKDSLFYVTDTDKKTYLNTANETFYFSVGGTTTQYNQPVIYKKNNKYGLVIEGELRGNIYDSLFYFGTNYLAYVKEGGKFKCGVLFANGDVNVPLIYDSIEGQMKEYSWGYNKIELNFKKTYTSYYGKPLKNSMVKNTSEKLVTYQNGKCGLLNTKGNIIIPVKYDFIADNNMQTMHPQTNNYIILKNDGKYGITQLRWNKEIAGLEMSNTIEPKFTAIPAYYYNDYYRLKGFKLFGLYDEKLQLISYANQDGLMYRKEE